MDFLELDTYSFPILTNIDGIPLDRAVGITTTVPIEIVFAAGLVPVDLNNVFISDEDPARLVEKAESSGLPRNNCAWIKGIFSAIKKLGIKRVIGVVEGDCSNTYALTELLRAEGVEVIPFKFPSDRNKKRLGEELNALVQALGTTMEKAEEWKVRLDKIRRLTHEIDRLTYEEAKVSGEENHIWTVSASDMMCNPEFFEERAKKFLEEAKNREPIFSRQPIRIGFIGVPPICNGLYGFLEERGAYAVFNETQRQFAMPYSTKTLVEQYYLYTYPYSIFTRLEDIGREVKRRNIHGIIHYIQSFCYKNLYDSLMRRQLGLPMLTLECDRPSGLDGQMRTRLEAFVEMLGRQNL